MACYTTSLNTQIKLYTFTHSKYELVMDRIFKMAISLPTLSQYMKYLCQTGTAKNGNMISFFYVNGNIPCVFQ